MISIAVTAVASGAHATVLPISFTLPGNSFYVPPLLLTGLEVDTSGEVEIQAGSKPEMDNRAWGELKDKGVKHLNATGSLSYTADTYVWDIYDGYPRAKRQNGTYVRFSSYCSWGDPFEDTTDFAPLPWTASGRTYTCEWIRTYRKLYWCEKGLVAYSYNMKAATYRDDGVVTGAEGWMSGSIQTYRHVGSAIYRMSSTALSSPPSGSYLATLGDAIPQTGGTTVSTETTLILQENGSLDEVVETLKQRIGTRWSILAPELKKHPTDHAELALECSKQLKFVDQNILLFILDVEDWRHFHTMWKSFANSRGWKKALRSWKKIKRGFGKKEDVINLFKPASGSYLFTKYAVLPSVSDLGRLSRAVERSSLFTQKQRLHSRRVTSLSIPDTVYSSHTAVINCQVAEYPAHIGGKAQEMISQAKRWGAWPEMINLWDLLPYSFCLDWFVDFGSILDQSNTYLDQKWYFPVDYCVLSEKWEFGIDCTALLPEYPVTGVVKFSYYVRWITKEVPLPSITLGAETTVGNHLLESTALVLQRL